MATRMRWLFLAFTLSYSIVAFCEESACIVGEWISQDVVTQNPFFSDKAAFEETVSVAFRRDGRFSWRGGSLAAHSLVEGTYTRRGADELAMNVNGEAVVFRAECAATHLTVETPDRFVFVFLRKTTPLEH